MIQKLESLTSFMTFRRRKELQASDGVFLIFFFFFVLSGMTRRL
jgi:hypothetical protein